MSCAGKGYGTNTSSNDYLNAQFYSSIVTTSVTPTTTRKCRKYSGFYPSFAPVLDTLSITSASSDSYNLVYVTGRNFLPNNTTFVKFGVDHCLPITYYSSFNISFVIPQHLHKGDYYVQVVNLYNNNFSPQVNQSYPGNLVFSNSSIITII